MKFFSSNNIVINYASTYVVEIGQNQFRPAEVIGRASRSGSTVWPEWVEAGAIPAYRDDHIPDVLPEGRLIVFSRHGTCPERIRELNPARLEKARHEWAEWREIRDEHTPPPSGGGEEYFLAKRRSRQDTGNGDILTHGEAIRGLLQRVRRWSPNASAELTIADAPDEDGDIRWELLVRDGNIAVYRAFAYAPRGQTPCRWKCSRHGASVSWEEPTPEGGVKILTNTYNAETDTWSLQ